MFRPSVVIFSLGSFLAIRRHYGLCLDSFNHVFLEHYGSLWKDSDERRKCLMLLDVFYAMSGPHLLPALVVRPPFNCHQASLGCHNNYWSFRLLQYHDRLHYPNKSSRHIVFRWLFSYSLFAPFCKLFANESFSTDREFKNILCFSKGKMPPTHRLLINSVFNGMSTVKLSTIPKLVRTWWFYIWTGRKRLQRRKLLVPSLFGVLASVVAELGFSSAVVNTRRWLRSNVPPGLPETSLGEWHIWLTQLLCIFYTSVLRKTPISKVVLWNWRLYLHCVEPASLLQCL